MERRKPSLILSSEMRSQNTLSSNSGEQVSAGQCLPAPCQNAPKEHINQHVLTAGYGKSHCLKPRVILEYLLLLFTAVFQGSFSL